MTRRADDLKLRCKVFERVARAVGSFPYVDRAVPLLLRISWSGFWGFRRVGYVSVNEKIHRGYDFPANISPFSLMWLHKDVTSREEAPSDFWMSPDSVGFCFCFPGYQMRLNYSGDPVGEDDKVLRVVWELLKPRKDHVSGRTP